MPALIRKKNGCWCLFLAIILCMHMDVSTNTEIQNMITESSTNRRTDNRSVAPNEQSVNSITVLADFRKSTENMSAVSTVIPSTRTVTTDKPDTSAVTIHPSVTMATLTNVPAIRNVTLTISSSKAGNTREVSTEVQPAREVTTDVITTMNANATVDVSTDALVTLTTLSSATEHTSRFSIHTMSSVEQATNQFMKQNNSQNGNDPDYSGMISLPIALVLGLTGNSITIATMITKPFNTMPWSITLVCLATADNVVLLAVPFNKPFIAELIGVDIPSMNTATCKVYHFIRRISKMVSAWLLVLVCFERFVAVCFPMKVKQICTKRRTAISVVCMLIVSAACCSLWVSTADIVNGVCVQTVVTPESRIRAMSFLILGSVLIVVLPVTVMFVLTPITCFVLRRHALLRTQLSGTARQTDNYAKASAMLVSLCVTYIVLLTPTMTMYNLAFYLKEGLLTTRNTTLVILKELSQVLELINYSSNFFLYTAFNDVFRHRVIYCVKCNARQAVSTAATSRTQMHQIASSQATNTIIVVSANSNACSMYSEI